MTPDLAGHKAAGDRMIVVHAVRAKLAPAGYDLDDVELLVNDGGGYDFDAVYDLDRGELMRFGVHRLG
ncbi:hypothetical protein [Sphingomonas abietis]|uniref:PepSY domain-containing protein n=1 Tax=Sphingomonas abietis TaxID=3012344 RepID=A0ABY7NT27_9SPHN|nr:hypothetical protein [Sphingomonas abietis]WBO23803.1 hypothetical protein PBT88_06690 [Sphingomonas abietis]